MSLNPMYIVLVRSQVGSSICRPLARKSADHVEDHNRCNQVDVAAMGFQGVLFLELVDDWLQRAKARLDVCVSAAGLHLIEAGDEWFNNLERLVGE